MTTNVLDPNEFPEILEMIRLTGGKYIIIEKGKPAFAVLGMDEYKKLVGEKDKTKECCSSKALIDKINSDIADWKLDNDEEEEEDYLKYIPERFRPVKNDFEECNDEEECDEEKSDFIEDDLAYHYDVDEEDEENDIYNRHNERYGENAPF